MTVAVAPPDLDEEGPSLAGRAALTVVMQLGLYVVAVLVLLAAVGLNYVLWINGRIHFGAALGALAVFVGIIQALAAMRIKHEDPFGLDITTSEPQLAAKVAEVAETVGAEPPDAIYLVPDVNAFVSEQSSWLGLRVKKRVLGVGLPLLHVTTVSEFQAILGHEFGHFAGGDTKLGALVYRGHEAARSLATNFSEGAVSVVFVSYAKLMHRVSGSVSRQQEIAADRFAVKAYGSRALSGALAKLDDAATAFEQYGQLYIAPLFLNEVYPADLFGGFIRVYQDPARIEERSEAVRAMAQREPSPYDTHPTPSVRLETLAGWPEIVGTEMSDDRPATSLLVPDSHSAAQLSKLWADRAAGAQTREVGWGEAASLFGANVQSIAELGFTTPLSPRQQLEQVVTWSEAGNWHEPKQWLMKHVSDDSAIDELLLRWIDSVVQVAVAEHGSATWDMNFSGPVQQLDSTGARIDTTSIARAFYEGRTADAITALNAL